MLLSTAALVYALASSSSGSSDLVPVTVRYWDCNRAQPKPATIEVTYPGRIRNLLGTLATRIGTQPLVLRLPPGLYNVFIDGVKLCGARASLRVVGGHPRKITLMGVQEIYFASPVGNIAGALSSAIVGGGVQLYARCRGDGLPGEYLRVADQQNDEYYFNNIYLPSTCKIGIIFQSLGGAILLSHTILVDQNTDKIEFNIGSGDLASAAADPHPPF